MLVVIRPRALAVAVLAFAGLAISCASAPAAPERAKASQPQSDPEAYVIGVGDVLHVSVWKNPDLEATVPVRPDGMVTMPLVGDVRAAGWRPEELQRALTKAFERYVAAPAVSVVVKEIHSRQVFVTGEVANPGAYDLQPRTKLMQAIAMAGGVTAFAKDRVIVLRDTAGGDVRFEMRLSAIVGGRRPLDNIVLQAGDTVIVP